MTGGGIHSSEDFWRWVLEDADRVVALQNAVKERQSLRNLAIDGGSNACTSISSAPNIAMPNISL